MKFSATYNALHTVSIDDTISLPPRFTARFDFEGHDHNLEFDIAIRDGVPVCEAIRIERAEGLPALSGAELRRLPLAKFIDFAIVNLPVREKVDGGDAIKVPTG